MLYYALPNIIRISKLLELLKIPHLLLSLRWKPLEVGLTAGAIALRTPLASRSKLGFQLDRDQLDRGDVVTSFAAHA